MKNFKNYVEIAPGSYWLGAPELGVGLNCNAYLIVDESGEALFIDPGNVLDFEIIYKKLLEIISLDQITHVVLHHQDPDLCSSMPLFEKKGLDAKIITHWRSAIIQKYYGTTSDFYLVNENNYEFEFKSGRRLLFIPTPYLHFPGSIMTYDPQTKILYSSDLFGAFSHKWALYADESYLEAMKTYHENYMPSNDILRPVMESLSKYDIEIIASQHGSIINKNINDYVSALRDLDCGAYLKPIKKDLAKSGGFVGISNQILNRYIAIYGKEEILEVFSETTISLDPQTGLVENFGLTGIELWNELFVIIYSKKGSGWLSIAESMVEKIVKEYEIEHPEIFNTITFNIEQHSERLSQESIDLLVLNRKLEESLNDAKEKLIKCPITDLYNESFFRNYLEHEFQNIYQRAGNGCLFILSLDGSSKIWFNHGEAGGRKVLKGIAIILMNFKRSSHAIFKLNGHLFAYYIPKIDSDSALEFVENIRKEINSSDAFLEKVTVSIGLVHIDEFEEFRMTLEENVNMIYNLAQRRTSIAKKRGTNTICYESAVDEKSSTGGRILIIDADKLNVRALRTFLEKADFEVLECANGEKALELIEKELPDLIISEVMIPRMNGIKIREKTLSRYKTKEIPYILMSHVKDENLVKKALDAGIDYYFKKPYMMTEVVGIIKNIIGRRVIK
jgi:diguanylate cyclase (GGDEF)-like protein